jgi:hypothetical protein
MPLACSRIGSRSSASMSSWVSRCSKAQQVWTWQGWVELFGLPFDPLATGYRHRAEYVAPCRWTPGAPRGHYDAIHQQTTR